MPAPPPAGARRPSSRPRQRPAWPSCRGRPAWWAPAPRRAAGARSSAGLRRGTCRFCGAPLTFRWFKVTSALSIPLPTVSETIPSVGSRSFGRQRYQITAGSETAQSASTTVLTSSLRWRDRLLGLGWLARRARRLGSARLKSGLSLRFPDILRRESSRIYVSWVQGLRSGSIPPRHRSPRSVKVVVAAARVRFQGARPRAPEPGPSFRIRPSYLSRLPSMPGATAPIMPLVSCSRRLRPAAISRA